MAAWGRTLSHSVFLLMIGESFWRCAGPLPHTQIPPSSTPTVFLLLLLLLCAPRTARIPLASPP